MQESSIDIHSPEFVFPQLESLEYLGPQFIAELLEKTVEQSRIEEREIFEEAVKYAKELIDLGYLIQYETPDYEKKTALELEKKELEAELAEFCTANGLEISRVKNVALQHYKSQLLEDVTLAQQNLIRLDTPQIFGHLEPLPSQNILDIESRIKYTKIIDKGIRFGVFVKKTTN